MKSLEHYTDFREFLKDFYEDRKKRSSTFSYRQFSLKAGIRSPSLLREVTEGRRNLTETSILQFIQGLGLTETDARFFTALVHYNQAQDPRTRMQWLETMRGLRRRVKATFVPLERHEYYSRWYLPVLRELACQVDWDRDFGKLGAQVRPELSALETEQAIDLLVRLGFLEYDQRRWIQPDPALTTGPEVDSRHVRAGNQQFADLGAKSIEEVPPSRRDVSTLVVGVSEDGFRRIKEEIRLFKERVARIAEDDVDSDGVFAVNVQLVPHSRKVEG
ncbi:MAG: TIGR02147 family protein [Fibrobacteria bacterium]|nr:TIGR02147 family protein [Fibrobacteria bacterium]